jgi:Fic family protein
MVFDPETPYNDLPLLPPAAELETPAIMRRCADARAALAALNQATALIPNPAMLINTLPILEARASSEIENIVTTADKLFAYASGGSPAADPFTREAMRYQTALREGFEAVRRGRLTTKTALAVCATIKNTDMPIRRKPGTVIGSSRTGRVIYSPPEGESVIREKLDNWERFLHDADPVDPLIRMAVAHYQFEAIHPFTDGNGRTGRILNILYLVDRRLLDLPVLYLSRFIIRRRGDYYRLLLEVTSKDAWEPWVLYMLEGVEATSSWTRRRIIAIRDLMAHTAERVRSEAARIYSHELVETIFIQPYCRIGNVVDAGIAKRQTASEYLKKLCAIGILEERTAGREKLFVNTALLDLLKGR